MIGVFIKFFVVAIVVVFASKKLAHNAEIIEENSSFNPIFMGLILAGATSLPELVSSLTSISLGNDVTGVSNVLGSNAFNVFALMVMNLMFIKHRIFRRVTPQTFKTAGIAIIMYILFIVTFIATVKLHVQLLTPFFHFTITTCIIVAIYFYSVLKTTGEDSEIVNKNNNVNLTTVKTQFLLLVIVNVIASMILAHTAEGIIEATGMSQSAVGAVLVGIATSLPEIITCYALMKKNRYEMAVTSIIGSNTFNFLTFSLLDIATKHSIYQFLDVSTFIYAIAGLLLSVIVYFAGSVRGKISYLIPSILGIIVYLAAVVSSAM